MESIADKINNEKLVEDGFERVKAELDALDPDDLVQVNLDVTSAVTTTLGVVPEVKNLRETIARELPSFDLAAFDKLEDYAYALHHAQAGYLAATQPPDDIQATAEEAQKARDQLKKDATALAGRGLLDGNQVGQLKGGNSHRNLALDLEILHRILKTAWPSIEGKSAITLEELQKASKLSLALMRAVGLREQGPAVLAAAVDTRLRAFTKFREVYENTRRAVAYLRADAGDADAIIPSLFSGRTSARAPEPTGPEIPGVPATPVVSPPPASPPVPVAPGSPAPASNNSSIGKNGPFV